MPESPPQLRIRDGLASGQLFPGLLHGLALFLRLGLVTPGRIEQRSLHGICGQPKVLQIPLLTSLPQCQRLRNFALCGGCASEFCNRFGL